MLRGIADFAMKGRWQAALAAALLSVAAMLIPPLNYLASGVIVLATLRVGPQEGLRVMAATLVVFAAVAGLLFGQLWIALALLLTSWLPAYLVTPWCWDTAVLWNGRFWLRPESVFWWY